MLERFADSPRILRQAVLDQQCVAHDHSLADELCKVLKLQAVKQGESLTRQGGQDNDIYLILAGRISIIVNGREIAIRQAMQHVGEMVTIDPSATRCATTIALEDSIVAKISEPDFATIAMTYPGLWRRLAIELANRLRQRSHFIKEPNPRPAIFIGSSSEGKAVAEQIYTSLSADDVSLRMWTFDVFVAGHGTIEDLEEQISSADFGVLVFTPDDHILNDSRKIDIYGPRDNVVLELGMCIGALGSRRGLVVRPNVPDLKVPSDLDGITNIVYVQDAAKLAANIDQVHDEIVKVIELEGLR
jgi:predicted nucleotide-binding protein